jgi:hypothetical protein
MAAPTFGTSYMEMGAGVAVKPPTQAEIIAQLDPVFVTAWNQLKHTFPEEWQGDTAFVAAAANVAYRYKGGAPSAAPNVTAIAPTTTVHNVAFTLTITGTGFDASPTVLVGGLAQIVTAATLTSLTVTVRAGAIPVAGAVNVQVRNADGQLSNTTPLTVT